MNKTTTLAIIILLGIIAGAAIAYTIQTYKASIPTSGILKTTAVALKWLDDTPVTSLEWGTVDNGTDYTYEPFKIINTNTTNVTLALSTENWSPSIISLSLTWDYADTVLAPTESVTVILKQNIITTGDWSYTTVITATEAP